MKVLVTGHDGFVGTELMKVRPDFYIFKGDITKKKQVGTILFQANPDVIIHLASITSVDYCEENTEEAFDVNVRGIGNILDYFREGTFIVVSTDHVFDGKKYYAYSEKHQPNPVNIYGTTKLMGEAVAGMGTCRPIIVRTSKLFANETMKKDIEALEAGIELTFTDLILRSFLHVSHFVTGLLYVVDNLDTLEFRKRKSLKSEIINIAGTGRMSYAKFWQLAARELGLDADLIHARKHKIDESPRPFRAGLDTSLARKLDIPLYSAIAGLRLIKRETK